MILKQLTSKATKVSNEIRDWLNQFSEEERQIAVKLLLRIWFVPHETFRGCLENFLSNQNGDSTCALYAVRKFDKEKDRCLFSRWEHSGNYPTRPPTSLGSEDLVYSLISGYCKQDRRFLDHPSISELREKKVRKLILIDDSIGSGDRVCDFLKMMFSNKSLKSWFCANLFRIHIWSFCRYKMTEHKIMSVVPGKKRGARAKEKKVTFSGVFCFHDDNIDGIHFEELENLEPMKNIRIQDEPDFDLATEIEGCECTINRGVSSNVQYDQRWGTDYAAIVALCEAKKKITKMFRKGYGNCMSNIVFYHCVPNNVPGILCRKDNGWSPLWFKILNSWMSELLDAPRLSRDIDLKKLILKKILKLINWGVTRDVTLARKLSIDISLVNEYLHLAQDKGFLIEFDTLTQDGFRYINNFDANSESCNKYDYSLHIPKTWCIDRPTV